MQPAVVRPAVMLRLVHPYERRTVDFAPAACIEDARYSAHGSVDSRRCVIRQRGQTLTGGGVTLRQQPVVQCHVLGDHRVEAVELLGTAASLAPGAACRRGLAGDRKSTRLNSS